MAVFTPDCATQELDILPFAASVIPAADSDYDTDAWLYAPTTFLPYRYVLGRRCGNPLICIGINPSTADPTRLDPTLQSVERVAKNNGFDGFAMMNVYPQRATVPKDLDKLCNPILHKENLEAFRHVLSRCDGTPTIWAAWGTLIERRPYLIDCLRDIAAVAAEYGARWVTFGARSKAGHPHHPLYLRADSPIEAFDTSSYLSLFDRARIVARLNSQRYVQGLILCENVDSTNTKLREMAQNGASAGCTIIAKQQGSGRGRRGRTFASPEGGLYLSTLLQTASTENPGIITCRAAVAAARAIESLCDAKIDIKWVNDLYLNNRKVAGILAEGVLSPDGGLSAVVLGIGVNIRGHLPPELDTIATTLEQEGYPLNREDLAAAFLNEWELAETDPHWMAEYRRRNLVLGRDVTVLQGERTYPAIAVRITDEGHLVVRTDSGETALSSGEVSVRL